MASEFRRVSKEYSCPILRARSFDVSFVVEHRFAHISLMYGRFRVLSGDISLMYGSPKGEKPEKCTPEVGFSHDGLPYISEKAHDKAPILPYIRQI